MKRLFTLSAVMLVCVAVSLAQCTSIAGGPIPSTYLSSTNKCSIGDHTLGGSTNNCFGSDGNEAEFGAAAIELAVGHGWGTWNVPPFAETSTPWVGFTSGPTNQINLTAAASVMGVEIEPNAFVTSGILATFYDGQGNVLATVQQFLSGSAGSMLFAAMCPTKMIHSVVIQSGPQAQGFAFANVRADSIAGNPTDEKPTTAPVRPLAGAVRNH